MKNVNMSQNGGHSDTELFMALTDNVTQGRKKTYRKNEIKGNDHVSTSGNYGI